MKFLSFVDGKTIKAIMQGVTENEVFGTILDERENERSGFVVYSFAYGMRDDPGNVRASVYHYIDTERARARLGEKDKDRVRVQISDTVAATLHNSYMERIADHFYKAY